MSDPETINVHIQFFQRLRPVHRFIIAFVAAVVIFYLLPAGLSLLLKLLVAWLGFSVTYLVVCWIVINSMQVAEIKKTAAREDGSKIYVFTMILVASFACMFAVLLLIMSGKDHGAGRFLAVSAAILAMMLSWTLVHTLFTFHYAHIYYLALVKGAGLRFPGREEPDYLDFAYFSFGIGCTFQVADVEITHRDFRRLVLAHSVLSFALNTFVVALTINIIAGLTN